MKTEQIRILLLSLILFIIFILTNKYLLNTENNKNNNLSNHIINNNINEYENLLFKNSDKQENFLSIQTSIFNNIKLDFTQSLIEYVSLKEYKNNLQDNTSMPLIQNTIKDKYILKNNTIFINGKKKDLIFTEKHIKNLQDKTIITLISNDKENIEVKNVYTIDNNQYIVHLQQFVKNNSNIPVFLSFDNSILKSFKKTPKSFFSFLDINSYSSEEVGIFDDNKGLRKKNIKQLNKNSNYTKDSKSCWISIIQHYFTTVLIPICNNNKSFVIYYNNILNNEAYDIYQVGIKTKNEVLQPQNFITNETLIYIGPKIIKNFNNISKHYQNINTEYLSKLVDYGILSFVSILIFWLLSLINTCLENWGFSIILTTIVIKAIFYPLSSKSYLAVAKLKKLQPRINNINKIYENDKVKIGKKMLEIYKKEKINPISGFLPLIIQIPVFIALYWVILESVELRHAKFIFWIQDLSSKDPFFVLPIFLSITMLLQQKLNVTKNNNDNIHNKILTFIPLIFMFIFISFPAGLILYWLTNNIISIIHQRYINFKYS